MTSVLRVLHVLRAGAWGDAARPAAAWGSVRAYASRKKLRKQADAAESEGDGRAYMIRGSGEILDGPGAADGDDEVEAWDPPIAECMPMDSFEIKHARSGGPGGQNVNKVNTKVDMRFRVDTATWIPEHVRERFAALNAGKINKQGEFVMSSTRQRTQYGNLQDCLNKLRDLLVEAAKVQKARKATAVPKRAIERRLESKKRKSEKKQRRGRVDF